MRNAITLPLRALLALAIVFTAGLAIPGKAFAQDQVFDVKAASGADGLAGEYPLQYTINYSDGTSQDVNVVGDGTTLYTYAGPADVAPVSIIYLGQTWVINSNNVFCFPRNAQGGCWCLCLQWVRVWPWWVRPRWFWYYNPCC